MKCTFTLRFNLFTQFFAGLSSISLLALYSGGRELYELHLDLEWKYNVGKELEVPLSLLLPKYHLICERQPDFERLPFACNLNYQLLVLFNVLDAIKCILTFKIGNIFHNRIYSCSCSISMEMLVLDFRQIFSDEIVIIKKKYCKTENYSMSELTN